jgi:hypothetical protein
MAKLLDQALEAARSLPTQRQRAEGPRGQYRPARPERDGETVRLTGAEALALALDSAGIAVVRVTSSDVKAIEALRQDEYLARITADSSLPSHELTT